jgi:pre-rRNA-processing protein TSR4
MKWDLALDVTCAHCQEPMPLLAQIYAPLDEFDQGLRFSFCFGPEFVTRFVSPAFHRKLYIFCCPKVSCWKLGRGDCVRVYRCQMGEHDVEMKEPDHACAVCGSPASKMCSQCKHLWYCSKAHQLADWQAGHKGKCSAEKLDDSVRSFGPRFRYKELVIETEEEESPLESEDGGEHSSTALITAPGEEAKLTTTMVGPNAQVDPLLQQLQKTDVALSRFQQRTAHDPDQILRYCFGASKPLWVHSASQLVGQPPNCESCGSKRVFELQLMPQLLFYLDLEAAGDDTAMDWSTIVIYSCERSCSPPTGHAFLKEVAFVQNPPEK